MLAMKARKIRCMTFPQKLKLMLRQRGWSQQRFSSELDGTEVYGKTVHVSKSKVSDWTTGRYVPDLTELAAISRMFGVSPDYLLFDEVEEPRGPTLGEDARMILLAYTASSLTPAEALTAFYTAASRRSPEARGIARTLGVNDLSEHREETGNPPKAGKPPKKGR